jgi:cardiolipin synthase
VIARKTIPNLLTIARLLCVPIALLVVFIKPSAHLTLLLIFLFASATDFLDGFLARRWNATSKLGTMLDPVADKLLVALMLIYLLTHAEIASLPAILILLREIYISGLRELMASQHVELPVSAGGKWKTALQMAAITAMLATPVFAFPALMPVGNFMLTIAAVLAVVSAVQYTRASMRHLL